MQKSNLKYLGVRSRMVEKEMTQKQLAKKINMCSSTLNSKLNKKTPFTTLDIYSICEILEIDRKDIVSYFF